MAPGRDLPSGPQKGHKTGAVYHKNRAGVRKGGAMTAQEAKAPYHGPKENPTVRAFLRLLGHVEAGGVTEVCFFDGESPSHIGYFDDMEKAARNIGANGA